MVNCTKCGTAVDHPVKTWMIKQTPVALYACPSCNTKWRSKFTGELAIPSVAKLPLSNPQAALPLETTNKVDESTPTEKAIETVVQNHIEPNRPVSIFSGIKSFLAMFFS